MQVGRNDPCPCGSGRKYKKCCRPQSEAGASLPIPAPPGIATLIERFNSQRYDAMETGAEELIALEPLSGPAWKMLSIALARQGKDSLAAAERAAALLPTDPDAHNNCGLALQGAGLHDRAAQAFRRALLLEPRFADAALNLGATLQAQGELSAAAECCRRAIELRPDFAAAYNNLGNALRGLGQPQAAVSAFRRVLQLEPYNALALNNLGNVLRDLEANTEAIASFERAIELRPDLVEAHCNLGILARLQGDVLRAEEACRRALELDPQRLPAILLHASLCADAGDFKAALAACRRALELDPLSAEALAAIPAYGRMTQADASWEERARNLAAGSLAPRRAALLHFALGKYYDDLGNHSGAFASYTCANELVREMGPRYDPAAMEAFVERLTRLQFDLPKAGATRAGLIVGMPRSGTSLAEQILASHPQVRGAGELSYWRDWWAERPRDAPDPAAEEIALAGERYLALLAARTAPAPIGIDKMPYNFLYLGLIAAALPGVRIIHMQRDPRDTALSIYFQDFGASQAYANDTGSIAHYYGLYLRIMAHWRHVLPPGVLLELSYEELVADTPGVSRRMVDFLGLEWDPRCLDFQATTRAVTTASQWQVRQKIHTASVARWRHYEPYLGAISSLGPAVTAGGE